MTTGYSGRLLLLKLGDAASPEVFTTIAGSRTTTVSETEQSVDTTSKDDSGVRALLAGSILRGISVSGTYVFSDAAAIATLRTSLRAGTHLNYQIDVISGASSGGETLEGAFRITSMEHTGDHDGEAQFAITLESSGAVTSS